MSQATNVNTSAIEKTRQKRLLIEGWRGINHSFALVNQYQILELLRFENLKLFHRDLPFAFPHWTRTAHGSGLSAEEQELVDALQPPETEDVDCIYRACGPIVAGDDDDRRKTVTFMVTELGLTEANFKPRDGDLSFFTRDENAIVTPSHWSRERIIDRGFSEDKVIVVPHGVHGSAFVPLTHDERRAQRLGLGLAEDDIVFFNVGLPTWNKGSDLILLAFAKLRSAGRKVRLIMKDQKDVYGLSIVDTIRELGRTHPELTRSDTLGAISVLSTNFSRADLRSLYGVADCYVSPYRAEGFNLPVLEAIACGTPVIVTSGGATDDFCNDDVALRVAGTDCRRDDLAAGLRGRYIEPNLAELTEAMDHFCKQGRGCFPGFDDARQRVVDRFSWANAAADVARLTVGERIGGETESAPSVSVANTSAAASRSTGRLVDGLVNVALAGSASQSSIWASTPGAVAANAASGRLVGDFAFHTDKEDKPWWQIDLGASYPIEAILVHNRLVACRDRARTMRIEIAERPGVWTLIHAGFAEFGGHGSGHPFESWINGVLMARYVRISLETTDHLHLSQVEVLVRSERVCFERYRQRFNLVNFDRTSTDFGRPYMIEVPDGADPLTIVGLKINYCSRFGNLLHQYIHAIQLARATELKYIQFGRGHLLNLDHPVVVDGITLLPADATLPAEGAYLVGSFFDSSPFTPILSPFLRYKPKDEAAYGAIARNYLRPHFLSSIPLPDETHPPDELTIHIRSGDLFVGEQAGNRAYRQPPLSFYTLVVERMRARGIIDRIRLVFEDRGNPCIDRLEAWLVERGIPCRTQCGTLQEDMSALIDAPHLVFGYGTFGYAVCRLSTRIETLHYFTPELGGSYADIPSVDTVYAVSDAKGGYIKAGWVGVAAGEWSNSPEQQAMMVAYPAEYLRVETLRQDGRTDAMPRAAA